MRKLLVVLAVLAMGISSFAELKLGSVFSDGMVLQRDQKVAVWGWTDPGAKVTVSFAGKERKAVAGSDGKFMVRLKKMKASAVPQVLTVKSSGGSIEIKNVLVGEVWLCSGQSNMAMAVSKADNLAKEQASANHPLIRMFITERGISLKPLNDCSGSWNVCTPETVGRFSAAAYFFGREIQQELNVPVGLIHTSWGGTRIEAWSSMASLEQFPSVVKSRDGQDLRAESFTEERAEKVYATALVNWNAAVEVAKADGKKGPKKPKKGINPHTSQNYPANLYNAMINPFVPYGIRGAIWYQGEANSHSAVEAMLYRDLLENLATEWREDWGTDFPFYAVQLPNFKKAQTLPVEESDWALIRESFLKFHKEVPNAGIAIAIDVGMENNIHPTNKQAVGYRLAQQALAKTYKKNVVPGGPIYTSVKKDGNKMVISFDDIGSGLVEQGGTPLKTFAIAGADQQFVEAQAVIVDDSVIVSAGEIIDPVAVRYAWADNPVGCNLFNKEGFPASPFRTDDWTRSAE
jgi:sialate O-acetylesterase